MAWIELHQTLPSNRKTLRLMSRLKLRRSQAVGHLCLLWLWALDNARDGALCGVSDREIAQVADFNPKRAGELVDALVETGFLERREDGLYLHDWEDYAGRLLEMRRKNVERCKRNRIKKADASRNECETNANVSGLPYPTKPNQTEPDLTEQNQTNSLSLAAGGGAQAGGREERAESESEAREDEEPRDAQALTRDYLLTRGLLPEAWLGSEPEMVAECRALGDALFHSFAARPATEADQAKVFQGVMRQWQDAAGVMRCSIDPDRRDLLHYAFEQAALAGKPGNWPYIQGVLLRLHQRGITDLYAAQDYEEEREGGW